MQTDPGDGTRSPAQQRVMRSAVQQFLANSWLLMVFVVAVIVLAGIFRNHLGAPSVARACIVFVLSTGVLYSAAKTLYIEEMAKDDPKAVRFVIAFDAIVFIVVGLAATILACNHWEAAVLLAGSCLLVGGFFGLLFGYPQGVAQQMAVQQPVKLGQLPADASALKPVRDKTLLADSAATLGKVITGFTLAKIGTVWGHFAHLCNVIAPALGAQEPAAAGVLTGVILAYFVSTGFLAGLLLPSYFMNDIL